MINKDDFNQMIKDVKVFDEQRELLIKKSRDVLKLSKQVIYATHRDDLKEAAKLMTSMKKELAELNSYVKKNRKMYHQGSYKVAVQEYVEAALFFNFVKNGKLVTKKELNIDTDYYLLGLGDLTGELFRKAVHDSIKGKYDEISVIRNLVDEIYTELLKMNIRESEMRKKFDGMKYDLQKLEDLHLQVKLKK